MKRNGRPFIFMVTLILCWIGFRIWDYGDWQMPVTLASKNPTIMFENPTKITAYNSGYRHAITPEKIQPSSNAHIDFDNHRQFFHQLPQLQGKIAKTNIPQLAALSLTPRDNNLAEEPPFYPSQRQQKHIAKAEDTKPTLYPSSPAPIGQNTAAQKQDRFSAYGWIFWRDNHGANPPLLSPPGLANGQAQYGASQAGLILRARPFSGNLGESEIYARAVTALNSDEQQYAAGLSVKPAKHIPIRIFAEQRLNHRENGNSDSATAVFASINDNINFAHNKASLDIYGQAGLSDITKGQYFFDGQIAAQTDIAKNPISKWQLGGAIWTGGQKREESDDIDYRVDIGPKLRMITALGQGNIAIDMDYRFRIAGHAQPASGLSLTLNAGF